MIRQLGQVMLYVQNQEQSKKFWIEKMGFHVASELDVGPDLKAIEISPGISSETTFVLHNKEAIEKMNPKMFLGTPSLMFFTDDIDELYSDLRKKDITVGDLITMPQGRVFNFSDDEGNYFAVTEKLKVKRYDASGPE